MDDTTTDVIGCGCLTMIGLFAVFVVIIVFALAFRLFRVVAGF